MPVIAPRLESVISSSKSMTSVGATPPSSSILGVCHLHQYLPWDSIKNPAERFHGIFDHYQLPPPPPENPPPEKPEEEKPPPPGVVEPVE